MRIRGIFVGLILLTTLAGSAQAARFELPWRSKRSTGSIMEEEFGRLPVRVPFYLSHIIREASAKYAVDANLIAAVTFKESAFDPNAVSRRGAQGLMQLMPKTAKWLGVNDSFDPRQNVLGGTKYLKMMLDEFDGNMEMALAAYNAGPTRVMQYGPAATAEAVEYVAKIKTYL